MQTPVFLLVAAAALGGALTAPAEARAGAVHIDIRLGFPMAAHLPRVIYAPAVVYHPHVVHRPYVRHRHDAHHRYSHHHRHAHTGGYGGGTSGIREQPRTPGGIGMNSRLPRHW